MRFIQGGRSRFIGGGGGGGGSSLGEVEARGSAEIEDAERAEVPNVSKET
jgi:hypothetical protein